MKKLKRSFSQALLLSVLIVSPVYVLGLGVFRDEALAGILALAIGMAFVFLGKYLVPKKQG